MSEQKRAESNAKNTPSAAPFSLMRQMTSELDRLFGDWSSFRLPSFDSIARANAGQWLPTIEVVSTGNALVTRVDLPGMKKEDVSVEVDDGRLTLSGERRRQHEEKQDDVLRSECQYGSFYRSVPLPAGAQIDKIAATFADGVLEVTVPVEVKKVAGKKVPIETPAQS